MKQQYEGNCHCGNVSFSFEHEEITTGLRCNCSFCIRRSAIMTDFAMPPEALTITVKEEGTLVQQTLITTNNLMV